MSLTIRRVDYFYTTVHDKPGEAYRLLSKLAADEVNLMAFGAVPVGPVHTQLTLFPADDDEMMKVAEKMGLGLTGPHRALLIQGDDELGALVDIHGTLYDAGVNVYACNGVTDGRGSFGYVIYIRPEEFEKAARALEA